jgi:hypothetical protein
MWDGFYCRMVVYWSCPSMAPRFKAFAGIPPCGIPFILPLLVQSTLPLRAKGDRKDWNWRSTDQDVGNPARGNLLAVHESR